MHTITFIISIVGAVQGFFFSALLLRLKNAGNQANRYLALIAFLLSTTLAIVFLHFNDLVLKVPHLLGFTQYFTLLYGPLVFFYVSEFLNPNNQFKFRRLIHFLPFVILLMDDFSYLSISAEMKKHYSTNIFADRFRPQMNFNSIFPFIHFMIYLLVSFRFFYRLHQNFNGFSRNNEKTKFRWIKNILLVSGSIWSAYLVLYFTSLELLNIILPTLISASVYAMGYWGFKHPELFRSNVTEKYKTSSLSKARKKECRNKLLEIMSEERIYTDPDLNLSQLAHLADLSSHQLSQIINEEFGQNFSDFVNTFRVAEAKTMLLDPNMQHFTILAIGYEVGFNSKSAFYSAFKKHTNQSPSIFLEKHQTV